LKISGKKFHEEISKEKSDLENQWKKFYEEISKEKSDLENQRKKYLEEQEKISKEAKIPEEKFTEEQVKEKIPIDKIFEREKIVQGAENNPDQEKVSEVQKIVDVPDKIVEKIVASENSVTPDKIVEKISEEKTQIDTTELLKIENQHSEIQAEIENFKKITENYQARLEKEKSQNAAIFEWFGKYLGTGDRDLGKIISEIVHEEILARENSRKKSNVEEVASLVAAQVSELNSKLTQITSQNQKLEKNLALCESEIAEVKNHIQDENEHHKISLEISLKNLSEEIDIKLQGFTDILLQNPHQIPTKKMNGKL